MLILPNSQISWWRPARCLPCSFLLMVLNLFPQALAFLPRWQLWIQWWKKAGLQKIKSKWKLLSCVWLFATPWNIQSMEFCRILEWIAFSRGSSQPRDWTQVSCIAGSWASRKIKVNLKKWQGQGLLVLFLLKAFFITFVTKVCNYYLLSNLLPQ